MPSRIHCCCNCPAKIDAGLPDSLVVSHSILTSSGTGMPADAPVGSGPCGSWYHRYTESTALVDLIGDITYDYDETATSTTCGTCCFRYVGRGSYTPDCPVGDPGGRILFGSTPFHMKVIGGTVQTFRFEGGVAHPEFYPDEPYDPACCPTPTTTPCDVMCAESAVWSDGELQVPLPIYGDADLVICVNGNVVTICETVILAIPCQYLSGTGCSWQAANAYQECGGAPGFFTCDEIADETCGIAGSTLSITKTADLSAVSGADIWEKIKNADPELWVFEYESVGCSCAGGGCGDFLEEYVCGCDVLPATCFCSVTELGDPDVPCIGVVTEDAPVDFDCLYSVGTLQLAFGDEP